MTLIIASNVPAGLVVEPRKLPRGGTLIRFDQSVAHFWMHVDVRGPDECWPWTGATNEGGYGRWSSPYWPGDTYAHRIAYRMAKGPIPRGHEVDHDCHNLAGCQLGDDCPHRPCQNYGHLLAVTLPVNRRSHSGPPRKTHCPKQHAFDEANTYINARGYQVCRTCVREANRASHAKYRDQRNAGRAARRRRTAA